MLVAPDLAIYLKAIKAVTEHKPAEVQRLESEGKVDSISSGVRVKVIQEEPIDKNFTLVLLKPLDGNLADTNRWMISVKLGKEVGPPSVTAKNGNGQDWMDTHWSINANDSSEVFAFQRGEEFADKQADFLPRTRWKQSLTR